MDNDNTNISTSKIFRIGHRTIKKRNHLLLQTVRKSRFLRRNPNNYKKPNITTAIINEDS